MPVKEGVLGGLTEERADLESRQARGAPRDEITPSLQDAEDQALERLIPDDEDDDLETPQSKLSSEPITWKERDDVNIPVSSEDDEEEEGDTQEHPAGDDSGEDTQEEPDSDGRVGIDEALRALRRDGWTQEMIDRFGDDELRGFAEKATKRQSDIQAKLDERARLLDSQQKTDDGKGSEQSSPPGAPDLDAAVGELEEVFGEIAADDGLGRRAASVLTSVLDRFRDAAQTAQGNGADGAMLEALLTERARTRLGGVYPTLKSDKALFEKVARKATTFFEAGRQTGEYEGLTPLGATDAAWSDAARVILGAPPSNADRQERAKVKQAKAQGQPMGGRKARSAAPQYRTYDQAENAWLMAREAGDDQAAKEIERAMRRLRK